MIPHQESYRKAEQNGQFRWSKRQGPIDRFRITREHVMPMSRWGTKQRGKLAQGGRFAGWSLYMKDGKLKYSYNWFNKERYTIESPPPPQVGKEEDRGDAIFQEGIQ
jgi:hypothetical protein